ncbi:MAG: tungstate ABC transporter substrate-binding protein WtpA, partial [Thermoprotei archaeon]
MKTMHIVAAIALVLILAVSGYILQGGSKRELKIFHAGSLNLMLAEAEEKYEAEHSGVDIMREASGSIMAVRKISDLGKKAELVMVADVSVIQAYLVPKYADWSIVFASNEVVLAYTDKSKYTSEINGDNWYEVLMREGVKFGFSNPNLDPCGYRSLAALYMASKYYGRTDVW